MIELEIVLLILGAHFIGDFVFQSSWMAQNKSENWGALLLHTSIYTTVMSIIFLRAALLVDNLEGLGIFFVITFIAHTLQDKITSTLTSGFFTGKNWRMLFGTIGLDQFLHFVQLLITYKIFLQ